MCVVFLTLKCNKFEDKLTENNQHKGKSSCGDWNKFLINMEMAVVAIIIPYFFAVEQTQHETVDKWYEIKELKIIQN